MVFVYKKLAQFAVQCVLPPWRSESPVCATDNKPSCVLHLLGWFIGSRGFSSLERRPEFWVLQHTICQILFHYRLYKILNIFNAQAFLVLYSRFLLVIYFICSNVYLLILNSKFIPLLSSPLLTISLFSV